MQVLKKNNEKYCNSGGICDEAGGVDEELSEAFAEDREEYYPRENVG